MVSAKTRHSKSTLDIQEVSQVLDSFETPEQEKFTWFFEAMSPAAITVTYGRPHSVKFHCKRHIGSIEAENPFHWYMSQSANMPHRVYYPALWSNVDPTEWWHAIEERFTSAHTPDVIFVSSTPKASEYDSGKHYFEVHRAKLERDYPGEYIAIWKGDVVSHGGSFSEVAKSAYGQVGYHDMYIPKVGAKKRVVRLPRPRVVKKR